MVMHLDEGCASTPKDHHTMGLGPLDLLALSIHERSRKHEGAKHAAHGEHRHERRTGERSVLHEMS